MALQAVLANGLPGLALREVARLLDVSLPTVQRHFATRDDLWRACVDTAVGQVQADLDRDPDLAANLRAQVERSILRPRLTAAMANDAAPTQVEYLFERAAPVVEQGRARLQQAIDAGAVRPVEPSAVVALVGLGIGSLATSKQGLRRLHGIDLDDPAQVSRFVDALTDLLLRGLLPRS